MLFLLFFAYVDVVPFVACHFSKCLSNTFQVPEVVKKVVPEAPTPVPKKVEPAKGIANLN